MKTPKTMREDYRQPRRGTRQKFLWEGRFAEWIVHFPPTRYAHAGFVFYYPYNLTDARKGTGELVFVMKPSAMAKYLWVGLVDGSDDDRRVMVEVPLSGQVGQQEGLDWGEIRIPLSAFGTQGQTVGEQDDGGAPGEPATFDWNDVREIRLVVYGGRRPNRAITIRELRFDQTGKKSKTIRKMISL
jgi:hypothetical protein